MCAAAMRAAIDAASLCRGCCRLELLLVGCGALSQNFLESAGASKFLKYCDGDGFLCWRNDRIARKKAFSALQQYL